MKTVTIEYCTTCGYLARAASLAELILRTNTRNIAGVTLVPSGDGAFEVSAGDALIHSRRETGRHANPDNILAALA